MVLLVVGLVVVVVVIVVVVFLSVRSMRAEEGDERAVERAGSDRSGRDRAAARDNADRDRRNRWDDAEAGGRPGRESARQRPPARRGQVPDDWPPRNPADDDWPPRREQQFVPADGHTPVPVPRREREDRAFQSQSRQARLAEPQVREPQSREPQSREPQAREFQGREPQFEGRQQQRRSSGLPQPRGYEHDQDFPGDAPAEPSRRKQRSRPLASSGRGAQEQERSDDDWGKVSDEQYWAELSSDRPLATTARYAQSGPDPREREAAGKSEADAARPMAAAGSVSSRFGLRSRSNPEDAGTGAWPEPGGRDEGPATTAWSAADPGSRGTRSRDAGSRDAEAGSRGTGSRDAEAGSRGWAAPEQPTSAWSAADQPATAWSAPADDPLTSPSYAVNHTPDSRSYRGAQGRAHSQDADHTTGDYGYHPPSPDHDAGYSQASNRDTDAFGSVQNSWQSAPVAADSYAADNHQAEAGYEQAARYDADADWDRAGFGQDHGYTGETGYQAGQSYTPEPDYAQARDYTAEPGHSNGNGYSHGDGFSQQADYGEHSSQANGTYRPGARYQPEPGYGQDYGQDEGYGQSSVFPPPSQGYEPESGYGRPQANGYGADVGYGQGNGHSEGNGYGSRRGSASGHEQYPDYGSGR